MGRGEIMNEIKYKSTIEDGKIGSSRVFGTIPIFIASLFGLGIVLYYNSNIFSSLVSLSIFLLLSYKIFSKAEVHKYYKKMSTDQKNILFGIVAWEILCFGLSYFISKNAYEYLVNLFILVSISGVIFYIIYFLYKRYR